VTEPPARDPRALEGPRAFLPQLRYPWVWFAVGLLMAVVITITSLVPASRLPTLDVSDKAEHALAHCALAFWFGGVLARCDYVFLALALVAFGGGIEVAQGLMDLGRQADLRDLAADVVGIGAGILLALTPLGRWAGWIESRFTVRRA
jgi:VanZ family protein